MSEVKRNEAAMVSTHFPPVQWKRYRAHGTVNTGVIGGICVKTGSKFCSEMCEILKLAGCGNDTPHISSDMLLIIG